MNAGRCMVSSFGENTWTLFAAVYYLGKFLELQKDLDKLFNEAYMYVCTCGKDATMLKKALFSTSEESSALFSSCSESGYAEK
jgi:predicted SprT family Zn-dependent metalloprotease